MKLLYFILLLLLIRNRSHIVIVYLTSITPLPHYFFQPQLPRMKRSDPNLAPSRLSLVPAKTGTMLF